MKYKEKAQIRKNSLENRARTWRPKRLKHQFLRFFSYQVKDLLRVK